MPTTVEVIKGNILIAEFLGERVNRWKIDKWNRDWGYSFPVKFGSPNKYDEPPCWWNESALRFDTDWSWLMPAVEKIETIEGCRFKVVLHFAIAFVSDSSMNDKPTLVRGVGSNRLETTYDMVLRFINWYNNNPHP